MARAKLAQVELWSNFACAGGVRRAFVERPLAASLSLRLRGDSRATFDLPLDDAAINYVVGGAVGRFLYADQTFEEWRIDRLSTEVTPTGEVRRATLAAPLWDLGGAGPITEYDALGNPTFAGARYQITPSDVITTVILPWLAANGITWVSVGTIDPTAPLDIAWDEVTPLGLLHQLEDATQAELQLRRNGSTDYQIDLLTAINGSQPVADLREGKNLLATVLTDDATQRYSTLTGLGAADPAGRRAVIGRAVWEVTAVNTTTDRLTLTDPEGGDDPILEDDQLNGRYLYDLPSGTTDQILDTLFATQEVQVADASPYSVGDLLEVRLGAGSGTYKDDAQLLTSLSRPSITPVRVGTLDRPDLFGERNLVRNGWFSDWTNGGNAAPDGWTLHSGALDQYLRESTYAELGAYTVALRFQPYQVISPPLGSGVTTITLDSGYFYVGQTVEVFGYLGTVETFTVTAKTGTSITISGSGTGYAHSLTSYVRAVGQTFPILGLPYAWPGMRAGTVRAPVTGGSIFWGQAKVMLAGLPAGQYRAVLFVNRYNASNVLQGRIEAQTTVMDQWVTLGCSVQAAAGERLELGIELRDDPTYPTLVTTFSAPSTGRLLVDGASLTQTDYQPAAIPNYSFGNAFWQAVNRALSGTGAGTSYEVNIIDLTALDATGWPDDELLLGGTVRVNNSRAGLVNQLLRIVELQRPALFEPAQCTVVLNARRADLTELIDRAMASSRGTAVPGGGGGGSGQPIGTPATSALVPVKIPFHAAGKPTSPYDLPLGTHAAGVTEVDAGLQTWCDLTNAVKLRLETFVATVGATGAELAVRYSTDNGTSWAYLDGVDGPLVAIDALGPVAGSPIVPVVRGDVLLQLVLRGGDGVASPILRNTMLYVWYAVLAAPVPTPTPPLALPVACAIPGGVQYEGDFSAYADVAALYTARGDNADSTGLFSIWYGDHTTTAKTYLDTARLFTGAPALAGFYDQTSGATGSGFWTDLSSGLDDVTHFMVFEIENGFDTAESASDLGLQVMQGSTDNPVAAGRNTAGIYLRSGRVYFDWYDSSTATYSAPVDLGPASAWTGRKLQLITRYRRVDASTIEVSIYLDTPCIAPTTPLHQGTYPAAQASNQWIAFDHWNSTFATMPSPGKTVWMWQVGYDSNPAMYGL